MSRIEIKSMRGAAAFDAALEMQKLYWGDDARDLVPEHMLHSIARYGGHLLGAYDRERLVGILIGFVGCDGAPAAENLLIMSKRMLVLPAYRGLNIGFRLKLAQRELALKQGIARVTWTFDPLLSPNAHLNLRKLGALVEAFVPDYIELAGYGEFEGDRFLALWHLESDRVKAVAAGVSERSSLREYVAGGAKLLNAAGHSGGPLMPGAAGNFDGCDSALLEIPSDIDSLPSELAGDWRRHVRQTAPVLFAHGMIISDFVSDIFDGRRRAWYYFSSRSATNAPGRDIARKSKHQH